MNQPTQVVAGGLLSFVGLGAAVWLFMPCRGDRLNEMSAMNALRNIHIAQQWHANHHPELGFACSLRTLSSETTKGDIPDRGSISNDVVNGRASGYLFYISECTRQGEHVTAYKAIAVPVTVKEGSERGYCTEQDGLIRYDRKGGSECTEFVP